MLGFFPRRLAGLVFGLAAVASPAAATPLDFLPVGDPLDDELRYLEVAGVAPPLPHLGMRPLQRLEIPALPDSLPSSGRVAARRLARALARDRDDFGRVPGATPRLLDLAYPEDQRLEISAGLEGSGHVARGREPALGSGSGLRLRLAVQTGRWLAYSHLIAGWVEDGLRFAEALTPGIDAILHSEESYLAYTGSRARWAIQGGRSRWHWGPGDEASLLFSRTSPALSGVALRLRIEPLRADGMIFNATLRRASREHLAAHRLEWEPRPGLRLGIAEAARYHASSWDPLHAIGVLPYTLVQNLTLQDDADTAGTQRNNVIAGIDLAWRVAHGTRLYGELLVDDLRTDRSTAVSKLAYQLGVDGVGTVRGDRVTWTTELTRVSRYVYTSFFGRSFVTQGVPLGYPTGPDSRRVRVRAAWDPATDWQLFGSVARTESGESGVDDPYLPGSGDGDSWRFLGTVEERRELDAGIRWWPASGLDVGVSAGYEWIDNAGHTPGEDRRGSRGQITLRVTR